MSGAQEHTSFRHLFLLTDLEGVAGVTDWRQTREDGPGLEAARALLTGEVNAFAAGLLRSAEALQLEAPQLTIWDGHGPGGLELDRIEVPSERVRHDDPRGFGGIFAQARQAEVPVDALAFIGQHAMEGTGGNLAHTYSSRRVKRHSLNGVKIGEFGTRALNAWALGVPTVFFSGDDIACNEATDLIPGLVSVTVKRTCSVTQADCLPHEESCRQLAEAAGRIWALDPGNPALAPRELPAPPYLYRRVRRPKWGILPLPDRVSEGNDLAEVLGRI